MEASLGKTPDYIIWQDGECGPNGPSVGEQAKFRVRGGSKGEKVCLFIFVISVSETPNSSETEQTFYKGLVSDTKM